LTTAFLDMDRRQSAADAATIASEEIFPERELGRRWAPVREHCYAAGEAYLALTAEIERAEQGSADISGRQQRLDTVVRQLQTAAPEVDRFYHGSRDRLDEAIAVRGAVPELVARVTTEAVRVRTQAAGSEYAGYPSVRAASARVDEAIVTVEAVPAEQRGRVRSAANELDAATTELSEALAQAPSRAGAARNAIASVTTRIAAVRTRAERLGPAYSALLREFNAASSADLADNERASERHITAADAALAGARAAAAEHNPEPSLDLTTTARGHLADAEQLVDAVTKRLTELRAVRDDPRERAEAVRFRLRDAQMLAVSRGLVAEWGSVLDAQVERLDRVTASLTGRHPDYWAYMKELDTITEFIAGVVDRMRRQPGQQQG
jgi:chromosome segregation ATPase